MQVEHFFNYFKPTNYNLTLKIDRPARLFHGRLILTGQTQTSDRLIKLHANYLTIETVEMDSQAIDFDYQNNVLAFKTPADQPITITYSGEITDQMNGIYPCYYQLDGQTQEIIATQFESHYAREVFPCIDEPATKATFDLTLITENDKTVLSNTEIIDQIITDQQTQTTFATTPRMSCYTLAFVIGDFNKKSAVTKSGVEVNVYATPAHDSSALEFALNTAVKSIDFYEDFLNVKYPLSKCDHIALPDFAAGAMENWGLITYRESMMLADDNTAVSTKKQVATTIAHELAHMWFGNLVTMQWWDELWLNESLATLFEHYAIDEIYPEYQIWDDFYSFNYQYAQTRDALPGVQPILTPINHPDEISTIFDGAIVYAKGACVMKMLQNYLGIEAFRAALTSFLQDFAYQNPTTNDFLHHFNQVSSKDISQFMVGWLHQSGFPLLTIDDNQISQQQFGYQSKQTWQIPLNNPKLPKLLIDKRLTIDQQFILVNQNIASFAVTNYSSKRKHALRDYLTSYTASNLDRFYFLSNQIILAKHNYISSAELVDDLQSFIGQNSSLLIWNNLARMITSLRFFVEQTGEENNLKQLVIKLAKPQFTQLGYTAQGNDTPEKTELRALLIGLLSYAEEPDTKQFLLQTFTDFQDNLIAIEPDLRSIVLTAKMKFDFSEKTMAQLLNLYQTTHNPDFKYDLQTALTATRDHITGRQLIDQLNNRKLIKSQDLASWFVMLLRNYQLRSQAWNWLKENFSQLRQLFSENKDYADFARLSANVLFTDQDLDEYRRLFTPYQHDLAMVRIVEVGLNDIKLRNELFKRDAQAVKTKLKAM